MEEQQNNNSSQADNNGASEKTFTQADVDRIVGERLYDAKKKYGDYDELKAKAAQFDEFQEKNKTELEKANEKAEKLQKELEGLKKQGEIAEIRAKVSKDTGVPAECLSGNDEESCKAQATAILAFANHQGIREQRRTPRIIRIHHQEAIMMQCVNLHISFLEHSNSKGEIKWQL